MATTQIPRSVRELILRDLARQTRTPKAIADRHHVPVEAVTALRDHYGPGPVELLAAAEQLARPAGSPAPVPAPPVRQRTGHPDGLSSQDRRTCRAWALLTGRSSSSAGPMARDVVTEWLRLGRPEAPKPPASGPVEEVADRCPACEAEGEQLAARRADDLDRFYGGDLQALALAEYCHAVAHAVERLRDARAEHEHRESLVQRVRAAIQPQGLHLTVEQVRLILAAVDEVA